MKLQVSWQTEIDRHITPVFKKINPWDKANYRPVKVLPLIFKIYEKLLHKQINNHIENISSPCLCGYRKGYSTQHALICLIETWKEILDEKGFCGKVLMDLSIAFDTIKHELLIAKLHAYGFEKSALKLLLNYLSNRWHRTKITKKFSSWVELIQGVPLGLVLGPLLFNIYLNDLFLLVESIDTIKHELLIAKLHAYGFEKSALKLLLNYLSNRWHRTKITKKFSSWVELIQGVPLGLVLGPLLFNIYLNDLFLLVESTEVCNFADDH